MQLLWNENSQDAIKELCRLAHDNEVNITITFTHNGGAEVKVEPTCQNKIGLQTKIKNLNKNSNVTCETCKHYHPDYETIACERCLSGKYSNYEPKTELQIDYTPDCPFCRKYGTEDCLGSECRRYKIYKNKLPVNSLKTVIDMQEHFGIKREPTLPEMLKNEL